MEDNKNFNTGFVDPAGECSISTSNNQKHKKRKKHKKRNKHQILQHVSDDGEFPNDNKNIVSSTNSKKKKSKKKRKNKENKSVNNYSVKQGISKNAGKIICEPTESFRQSENESTDLFSSDYEDRKQINKKDGIDIKSILDIDKGHEKMEVSERKLSPEIRRSLIVSSKSNNVNGANKKKKPKYLNSQSPISEDNVETTDSSLPTFKTVNKHKKGTNANQVSDHENTPAWQGNGFEGYRLSQILPDINWNPDPSKWGKNKVKCESLESLYPLSFRAMDYMLRNDFELPKLNTIKRRSLFKYPSDEEKAPILQKCPKFKSGRFNFEEKESLTLKLREYFENVHFSNDEQRLFITEMESAPPCPGGNRGSTSHNLIYAKLYFACHVAGRSFLKYRLALDLYNTIISLWKTQFYAVTQSVQTTEQTLSDDQKLNETEDEKVKGKYKTEDSCELIRSVISHLHSKGLPIEANEMKLTEVEWKQIQKETFRTPTSMHRHFSLVILPLLKGGPNEETWQQHLLKSLIDRKINYVQDIDWKELQKNHFQNQSTLQLRTFVSNQVHKRLRVIESANEKQPVYQILNGAYAKILDGKSRIGSSPCAPDKAKEIVNCYENIMDSLTKYSKGEVNPRKNDGMGENAAESNNPDQKLKVSDIPPVNKRRKKDPEFSKKAGEIWKELEDKSEWNTKAEDKERYKKKFEKWKAEGGEKALKAAKRKAKKGNVQDSSKNSKEPTGTHFKSKEYIEYGDDSSD